MFDYIREEELAQEHFAEDPGVESARRHNEWEAHWAKLEDEEANARYDDLNDPFVYPVPEECTECGGLGYTIEVNEDGEQYMDRCFPCYVEDQEAA